MRGTLEAVIADLEAASAKSENLSRITDQRFYRGRAHGLDEAVKALRETLTSQPSA